MNEPTNPEPLSLKKFRERIAKNRRWMIWVMGQCASIEGQATHRIDELLKMEQRLDELIKAEKKRASEAPPANW